MKLYIQRVSLLLTSLLMFACSTTSTTLYHELGGKSKINEIVNNFVTEIEYNKEILPYFEGSDIGLFIEKLSEQICAVSDGPCEYSGEDMETVHSGMKITEAHFNLIVDLLIKSMDKASIDHTTQNKLLARLAPMRKDMLYK